MSARQIQIRRGTENEHVNFTGAPGEITMDTTNNTLRVHDGETLGGTALAKKTEIPSVPTDIATADYVVESQAPTAENNYTWYRKYKSGWVEQGGFSTSQTITLPVEMADSHYTILLTGFADVGNNNTRIQAYRDQTVTGFITQCNIVNNRAQTAQDNNSEKYWCVFGFFA